MDLISLNNNNIIKLRRFLRNLKESLIGINLIKAKYIEFYTRITAVLVRNK
jgi:hypothetical protein